MTARNMFPGKWLASLAALSLMTACAGYQPPPPAFHEVLNQPYVLDAGDNVRITVFDQGDLSNTYAVDKAGYIAFPLVGSVPARGHTVKQVEAAVAQRLSEGFLRNPDVSAEVAQYRAIYVMGEVGGSGQYAYTPGMTVQNAIAAAGGFTPRALQANVDITRQINGKVMTGRVLLSDPLLPGDTIYVRERWL